MTHDGVRADDLRSRIFERSEVLGQSIRWNPGVWQSTGFEGLWQLELDWLTHSVGTPITRQQVIDSMRRSTTAGFLASMVWGFGPTGYGAFRTKRIISCGGDDISDRLQAIADAATTSPSAAYRALRSSSTRLRHLGPAFGTKVAYFAAVATGVASPDLPLISDSNTAHAVWHLSGRAVRRPVSTQTGYLDYVDWCSERALEFGVESDQIEHALFMLGRRSGVTWERWPA